MHEGSGASRGGGLGLASFVSNRAAALGVLGVTAAQLLATALGVPLLGCPMRHLLGLPCPGCGMSRAGVALLRGDLAQAMHWHAFSPLVAAIFLTLGVVAVLPEERRLAAAAAVARFERRRWMGLLLLAAFVGYWVFRIAVWNWTGETTG